MNHIIAHVVTASLALFTLADEPADKAAATPAPKADEPRQGVAVPRPGKPGKVAAPAKAAPGKPGGPGRAKDAGKVVAQPKAAEPAKAADAKPCEPIKPCAID
jgi:hypothetical protein